MIAGRLACAAAICLPLFAAAPARAGSAALAVALDYSAAPGCPPVGEFKSIVSDRLGYDAFREGVVYRVIARIVPGGTALEGHLEWRDRTGKWQGDRTFPSRSNDCGELARAMAFALALQIQLLATASPADDPGAAPQAETAEVAAAAEAPPAPVHTSPPPREELTLPDATTPVVRKPKAPSVPRVFAVGLGGAVGLGMSSEPVALGRVWGSIAGSALSLELGAEVGLPSVIRRQDGAGFAHQELLASLAGCGAMGRWSTCLVAKGGAIRIAGRDVDAPAAHVGPLLQTGLRLGLVQQLSRRVFLAARLEGLVTWMRPRVTLDQLSVWTSSRFAGILGLDVGLRLP